MVLANASQTRVDRRPIDLPASVHGPADSTVDGEGGLEFSSGQRGLHTLPSHSRENLALRYNGQTDERTTIGSAEGKDAGRSEALYKFSGGGSEDEPRG